MLDARLVMIAARGLFPRCRFGETGSWCFTASEFPCPSRNGALLSAVAMLANGWTDGPTDAPGFPKDVTWAVKHEGLRTWM